MQQQRHQRGDARAHAVVGQQRVLKLVFAHHVLGELDVQLVFRTEDLHVLGDARGEVFDGPGTQDCVLVLRGTILYCIVYCIV